MLLIGLAAGMKTIYAKAMPGFDSHQTADLPMPCGTTSHTC